MLLRRASIRSPLITVARVCLAIAALVAAGGLVQIGVADAQTTPEVVNSWSLSPSGAEPGQPGARPSLSYALAPGAKVDDSVVLRNYSNVQVTFRVYATDAFNNNTGDFSLLDGDTPPKDVGSWIKVSQESITLPPNSGVDIPITIQVPADAQPGDHSGAILASSRTTAVGDKGPQALLDRRVGSRIYLRVDGKTNPGLVVEDLSTRYHGGANPLAGDLDVTYTVRNAGNVRLGARHRVEVSDLFGTVESRKGEDIAQLLPGNSVTYHEHFSGVAATVRVSADVTVTPVAIAGADVVPQPATTRTAHAWAIPWSLLLLLAILAAVIWWLRRRQRSRTAGGSSSRPPGGHVSGGGPGSPPGNGNGATKRPTTVRGAAIDGRRVSPP